MNDQNKVDQMKEKFLEYWGLFLSGCVVLWDHILSYVKTVLRISAHYLKAALRKIAGWLLWLKDKWQVWTAGLKARFSRAKRTKELPAAEEVQAPEEPLALDPVPDEQEVPFTGAYDEAAVEVQDVPNAEKAPLTAMDYLKKAGAVLGSIGLFLKNVVKWIWKLRKVIMAAPVVWAAVKFAAENMERLPESVGLDIQSTGEFARMITRNQAVYWPLGITAFCLLLMFLAKKPLLPWVISIFTLVLPWLIWLTNFYA